MNFVVTDTAQSVPVSYTGMLPDLFKEGKGVVAQGKLGPDGVFRAEQVLAKHDENYMPPEAAEALEKARHGQLPKEMKVEASNDSRNRPVRADPGAGHGPEPERAAAVRRQQRQRQLDGAGAPSARAQFLFVVVAYVCLTWAFVTDDFSVALAANHSNSLLPLVYKFTAVWGNHEGSILLWSLILAGWTFAVTLYSSQLDDRTLARVLGVMGLISCGFLLFTLLTSNPFERLLPAAADGRDLNPLLQDPGMIIHPPMLYMGYVGFVVAFAFAIAALIVGRLDAAWARWSRPWTTVAWCFLTLGIALGSFWAYYELGWGGWWFWDPVENASFMPWLVGTALIHSLAVTEKRGGFKMWTVLLAILAFSLSLLGTFIVRSGVLSSVHAFATDPARGLFILAFLAVVVGGSLLLFAWRAPKVGAGGSFDLVSRESMLLANNVLLLVACAAVLLGTLYPLVLDALGLGKISVGPPYFDTVFVPLMAPALFLMGIGPIAKWRSAQVGDLARKLRWALAVSAISAVIAPFVLGHWTPMIGFGLLLGVWVASTALLNAVAQAARATAGALAALDGPTAGQLVRHAAGALRRGGVRHRRHRGQRLPGREGPAHGAGRKHRDRRHARALRRRARTPRPQLRGGARHAAADARRPLGGHAAPRAAHLPRHAACR